MSRKPLKALFLLTCLFVITCIHPVVLTASSATNGIIFQSAEGSTEVIDGYKVPLEGYDEKADMPNAVYYFAEDSNWNEAEKIEMITFCETILGTAKKQVTRRFAKPVVYFTNDNEEFEISNGKIKLCPTDVDSLGAIVSYACSSSLPVWLCAGIELYYMELIKSPYLDLYINEIEIPNWVKQQEERDLPGFGDAWMIRDFIRNAGELRDGVPYICLDFTRYLVENEMNGLIDIIKKMLSGKSEACLDQLSEYWEAFADGCGSMDPGYFYAYERFKASTKWGSFDLFFIYYSDRVRCEFLDYSWQYDEATAYINHMEEGIDYVLGWLECEYDFEERGRIDVKIKRIFVEGSYSYYGWGYDGIYLTNDNSNYIVTDSTHELVHYLTDNVGLWTSNTLAIFSEGLADLVQVERGYEKELHYYISYGYFYDVFMYQRMYTVGGRGLREYYSARMNTPYEARSLITAEMIYLYDDFRAKEQFSGRQLPERYIWSGYDAIEKKYRFLDDISYNQASSFTHYLYENYGKEKLLGAYQDADNIEELYGKTFYELIDDWKTYIGTEDSLIQQ